MKLNSRIAALSLRALDRWCMVTGLSLAQAKHIASKVQVCYACTKTEHYVVAVYPFLFHLHPLFLRSLPFSLPQINLFDLLSDAMYSDSRLVIDALAELIEHQDKSQNSPNPYLDSHSDGNHAFNVKEEDVYDDIRRKNDTSSIRYYHASRWRIVSK